MFNFDKKYIQNRIGIGFSVSEETMDKIVTAIESDSNYINKVGNELTKMNKQFLAGFEFRIKEYNGKDLSDLIEIIEDEKGNGWDSDFSKYYEATNELSNELESCNSPLHAVMGGDSYQYIEIMFPFWLDLSNFDINDIQKLQDKIQKYIEENTKAKISDATAFIHNYWPDDRNQTNSQINKYIEFEKIMNSLGFKIDTKLIV